MSKLISHGLIAKNKKARFNYHITDELEAGIILLGSEVKAVRMGSVSLNNSYIALKDGRLVLYNCYIGDYPFVTGDFAHQNRRIRNLLLHKRELKKLIGTITRDQMTIVPIKLFFNSRGICKVIIGVAKGKKLHDKRQVIKSREENRKIRRYLKIGNNY